MGSHKSLLTPILFRFGWAGGCPGPNGVTCAVLSVSSGSGFAKARVPLPIQRKEPVTQRSPLLATVSLNRHGSKVGETTIRMLWMPGRCGKTGERKGCFCLVFLVFFLVICYKPQSPKQYKDPICNLVLQSVGLCVAHTHTLTDTRNLMGLKPLAAGAEMQEPDALPCGILTLAILKVEGWAWQRGNWVLSNCMLRSLSPPT